ncbi:amidase domain-containing protein [Collinsella sp. zg1085]|uniref:amidase domain-containing protein n=1 Tax=Collinsella sp. zg1085 TaxID=2844380 RepID=UPI001C0E0059|nr:amidase domain-containing protein [Collinsella sp. zg1085]QWT17583.1 amidase domain-containing protein [Collinsella sp. zg1085]
MKCIRCCISAIALALIIPLPCYALEIVSADTLPAEERVDGYIEGLPEDISSYSIKKCINTPKALLPLCTTFTHPEQVIKELQDNKAAQTIAGIYKLDELSLHNWESYFEKYYELLDSPQKPDWFQETNENVRQFRLACYIFDNENQNEEISSFASTIDEDHFMNSDTLEILKVLLPSQTYNKLETAYELSNLSDFTFYSARFFDIDKANEYAFKYAEQPNRNYAYFGNGRGGDCTNFASQILEAGGEPQHFAGVDIDLIKRQILGETDENDNGKDLLMGWWHVSLIGIHKHSRSWTLADRFMKHFGVWKPYGTNHTKFSFEVRSGDFIGLDENRDGVWEHVGYVIVPGNGIIMPGGYRDYYVAQHSRDYRASVSSEINTWETYDGKAWYGIVRR